MANLSYLQGPPAPRVIYKTIPDLLRERAEKQPQHEAFIFYAPDGGRDSVNYSQTYTDSVRFAHILKSNGIKKGDRVIVHLYNTKEWLTCVFGLMLIGAVPVNVFVIRKDLSDLKSVAERTEAVGIIFTGHNSHLSAGIKELAEENHSTFRCMISVGKIIGDSKVLNFEALMSEETRTRSKDNIPNEIAVDPDDIAVILRSSGSTGNPKLIALSHVNLIMGFQSDNSCSSQKFNMKQFSNCEFSWLGGTPLIQIILGGTRVTAAGDQLSIPAEKLIKFTEMEGCETVIFTSNILYTINEGTLALPSCVKNIMFGGSPLKKKIGKLFNTADLIFCHYGSLETGGISYYVAKTASDLEDNIGGYPYPGVEVKIAGKNNNTVARGQTGDILVRHANFFLEYVADTDLTTNVISPSRWYNTGDFGYISEDGLLFVLGREGDCITSGTITTHVSEIEAVIEQLGLPQIKSVLVVAVPDRIMNEAICACVILNEGHSIFEDEMKNIINEKIIEEAYKAQYIVFVDSFPHNRNGKVDRNLIKKMMTKQLVDV